MSIKCLRSALRQIQKIPNRLSVFLLSIFCIFRYSKYRCWCRYFKISDTGSVFRYTDPRLVITNASDCLGRSSLKWPIMWRLSRGTLSNCSLTHSLVFSRLRQCALPSNTSTRVQNQNGISKILDYFRHFCRLTFLTDSICNNRPHLCSNAMRPNSINSNSNQKYIFLVQNKRLQLH